MPAEHGTAAVRPVVAHAKPAGHCWHCDADVMRRSALYVPTGHAFSNPELVPAGQ